MMLDGAGFFPTTIENNLDISTASATNLANAFEPYLKHASWENLAILLTAFATVAAAIAAYKSYQVAQNSLKNNVLQLFFSIVATLPMGKNATLSTYHKQLICNYFDYVCRLYLRKELKENDIDIMFSVMKEKQFVQYITSYRKTYGKDYFNYYWKWLNN